MIPHRFQSLIFLDRKGLFELVLARFLPSPLKRHPHNKFEFTGNSQIVLPAHMEMRRANRRLYLGRIDIVFLG